MNYALNRPSVTCIRASQSQGPHSVGGGCGPSVWTATVSLPGGLGGQDHPGSAATAPQTQRSQSIKPFKHVITYREPQNENEKPFIFGKSNAVKMTKCNTKQCKICPLTNNDTIVISYINRVGISVKRNESLTCYAANVIYAITCKKCKKQYVGETGRAFRTRIYEHYRKIKNKESGTFLVEHFNSVGHSVEDMEVTILEKCQDSTTETVRRNKEDFWIRALVTAYPFGFNDKIEKYGNISRGINPMHHKNHPYFSIMLPKSKRKRKNKSRTNKKIEYTKIDAAKQALCSNRSSMRCLYQILMELSHKELLSLYQSMKDWQESPGQENELCLKCIIAVRFGMKLKSENQIPTMFIPTSFPNKGMELIKLHTVFKDKRIRRLTLVEEKDLGNIILTYQYEMPIGLKYFSHTKELRNMTEEKLDNLQNSTCKCSVSPFLYMPANHIVSGNLDIVQNTKLRKFFSLGAKYRTPKHIDWEDVRIAAHESIDLFLQKLCRKYKKNPEHLTELKEMTLRIIENRINFFENRRIDNTRMETTEENEIHRELARLKALFIIAPADKAANNFIFICKKYYLEIMCKEMGFLKINGKWEAMGNQVYEPCKMTGEELLNKHQQINENWNLKIHEEDKVIPLIYGLPKLHKTPYKFRFIAGASKSSFKSMSILLTKILTFLKTHLFNYCQKVEGTSGNAVYWSIDSSKMALDKFLQTRKPKCITTADFSTLYTSLPHDLIIKQIKYIVEKLFNNSKQNYLCVGYKNCFFFNEFNGKYKCLDKMEIMDLVKFVLDNTYVRFCGYIFKQVSGIPMGGNASPLIADLTLSCYELQALLHKDLLSSQQKRSLKNTCRYIDDLGNINATDFMDICKLIYPDALPLENTSISAKESNYLDLNLKIENSQLTSTLYNKVDAFNFHVIRLPEASSNIHSNICYNTYYSQVIRIGRICSIKKEFEEKIQSLTKLVISKNYNKTFLRKNLLKFAKNYRCMIYNLGYTFAEFVKFAKVDLA